MDEFARLRLPVCAVELNKAIHSSTLPPLYFNVTHITLTKRPYSITPDGIKTFLFPLCSK